MFSRFANLTKLTTNLVNKNKRFFDLHEYQAKQIMDRYKVRVQRGDVATTPQQAEQISKMLDPSGGLIVKAQVHAGGRGKGMLSSGLKGGVQVLHTPEQVLEKTKQMIGYTLVTHQTRKEGLKVDAVLVVEGIDINRQIYLAFVLDRNTQRPALVVSNEGGIDIEEVAKTNPGAIKVFPFEQHEGLTPAQLNDIVKLLNLEYCADDAKTQLNNLYRMFKELDCTQVEINPWATDAKGRLFCVDAKLNIDDNAKFRQKDLVQMRSTSLGSEDVDPHEEKATKHGLAYVALDGNIGCLVNGAGLAMATMDTIKLYGEEPANFLDVGGGASVDQCKVAFQILSQHPKVKCIFINIFGGILSCRTIAEGISQAAEQVNLKVPLVIRLAGNASDEGRKAILEFAQKKGYNFKVAGDMAEGAKLAAEIVRSQKN